MRLHVELQTERNVAAGMNPDEARYAAQRQFGNVASLQERAREGWGWLWLEQVWQDTRYAVRQLRRSPAFAVTTIGIMAIGIGASTALFSVVNGVLLRPLPFPDSERVVMLSEVHPVTGRTRVAPAVYLEWSGQASSFAHMAAVSGRSYLSQSAGRGEKINAQRVTASFFPVLGVSPILGRTFTTEEEGEGANRVVVLSHRFWQSRFGGRRDVLNETIELDDQPYSVIGVMPDLDLVWNPPLFTPRTFTAAERSDYGSHNLVCIGRLKPGVSHQQAQGELESICRRIALAHPDTNRDRSGSVRSLLPDLTSDVGRPLYVLLGAVGIMLLIAVVNVAGLLLARAGAREREMAVRASLGAGRGRMIRQALSESLLLALAGGVLGVFLARWSLDGLAKFASRYLPRTDQIVMDGVVLALSTGLIIVTGLTAGVGPALHSIRRNMVEAFRRTEGNAAAGGRVHRTRSVLVTMQLALTLTLLCSSGLLARSWLKLQQAEQGFDAREVYLTQFDLGTGRKYDTPEKIAAFARAAIEAISALPEVESAALTTGQPMLGFQGLLFRVEGRPELPTSAMPLAHAAAVTPDYFKAMRIPLKQGRGFETRDALGSPRVAIISEELARRFFPGENPIGRRIMLLTMSDQPDAWREIIGVAGDVKPGGPQSEPVPQVYEPLAQRPEGTLALVVRSRVSGRDLPTAVNDAIGTVDPMLPVPKIRPYRLTIERAWSRQQFSLLLFSGFSTVALLLSVVGIYGITAHAVTTRTQEIGIRMALGALPRDIIRLIVRGGARIALAGAALGLAGSLAFQRVLQSLLYETSPLDPPILLAVFGALASAALLRCWLPARRAARVDPVVALRAE